MPTYRAYLINGDNRVSSFREIDAATDAEALKAARQLVDGCDVEVWHLDRKVGRLGGREKVVIQFTAAEFCGRAGLAVPTPERTRSSGQRDHKFEMTPKYRNDGSTPRFCFVSFILEK